MIRPTQPNDTPPLVQLSEATGVFQPYEIETLREVLDDYHAGNRDLGHLCWTAESEEGQGGSLAGYVYYAPEPMTDRTWCLWWIAVDPAFQRQGVGVRLLHHAEADIRSRGGRLLLIETSSLPAYERTRQFYLRQGYEIGAVVRDYYHDGDNRVFFRKRLADSKEAGESG